MSRDIGLIASVKARLQNKARESNRPFNDLLQLYGIERFLYRLSCSPYANQFVLKGALMLLTLDIPSFRPTRDIDLLGYTSNNLKNVLRIVREICSLDVEPDGITFDLEQCRVYPIKEDADYEGVRVLLQANLGKARIPLQIDIGFADVITPATVEVWYPTLLSFNAPLLRGYPLETIVAEKLQAMVFLGSINSRMKDFYDLWVLTSQFEFDKQVLCQAILRTFHHRNTAIPSDTPVAFRDEFAAENERQWQAFVQRSRLGQDTPSLLTVVQELRSYFSPYWQGDFCS